MRKSMIALCITGIVGAVLVNGCSKEDRDEAINRLGDAGKALNGKVRPSDKEHGTPNIVAEQQRKERIRQNTNWTPENQAKFPVEYCQAMLDQVAKEAKDSEVVMHKCLLAKSTVSRKISEDLVQQKRLDQFMASAKKAYREADAVNKWPTMVNGFSLSKEKLQERIVDAAGKLKSLESGLTSQKFNLTKLEKKIARVAEVQRKLVSTKDSIQRTLDSLQLKNVVESEDGIKASVAAINDALGALGGNEEDVSLDDLVSPDKTTATQEAFDAIMAN